jgi:hypothetical protein
MRIAFIASALTALAVAFPRPQDDPTTEDPSDDPDTISLPFPAPTIPIMLTTSLNVPVTDPLARPTSTKSKKPHWEPIPIFTKACKCDVATVRYPCWATDALQVSKRGWIIIAIKRCLYNQQQRFVVASHGS